MSHSLARFPPEGAGITTLEAFLQGLARRGRSRGHLVYIREIPARHARFASLDPPLPEPLGEALQRAGVERLYTHQVDAIAKARGGRDVLVVTGTASGKSLAYQLPVLENLWREPEARALLLFPTKALEQDQLKSLRQLLPRESGIRVEILDGDTPAHRRAKLKEQPPHILISNPDLLHLSLLPHHAAWQSFWERLRFVVLDGLHTYKGIFGSHIAHVMRRLHRVTAFYGSQPRFVACSATISNPAEFARCLADREFAVVDEDGSPAQGKRFVFVNPVGSPYGEATDLLSTPRTAPIRTNFFQNTRTWSVPSARKRRPRWSLAGAVSPSSRSR